MYDVYFNLKKTGEIGEECMFTLPLMIVATHTEAHDSNES